MTNNSARDKTIEDLVKAQLRAGLAAGSSSCPPPEIIAAYVEGALAPKERKRCDLHLASCAACQTLAAELVRLSEGDEPADVRVLIQSPKVASRFRIRWAWARPALAAMLVVGIWYTGEFRQALRQPKVSQVQKPPQVANSPSPPGAPPSEKKTEPNPTREALASAPSPAGVETPNAAQHGAMATPTQRALLSEVAKGRAGAFSHRIAGGSAGSIAAGNVGELGEGNLGGPISSRAANKSLPAAAAPAPPGAQSQTVLVAPKALSAESTIRNPESSSSKPKHGTESQKKELPVPGLVSAEPPGDMTAAKEANAISHAPPSALQTVMAQAAVSSVPQWRVGPRGLIQKMDSKGNWKKLRSGVKADLNEIEFPSPNVGWVVGEAGTILRTTDGGKSWSKLPRPTEEDLIHVFALSDQSARVVTRSGLAFITADGGQSWAPAQGH